MASAEQGPGSRASINDVAALAGVSVATVSRALRGLPNVSSRTRERVEAAATQLDYIASPMASGLVTGRVNSVGVVMPYAGRWFFAEIVRTIEETLRSSGYDLVLHVLADAERRAAFFDGLPVRRRVDAVLVVALPLAPGEVQLLRSVGVPLVAVGEPVRGVRGERIDNAAVARLATNHLLGLGHRRIATIGEAPSGLPWYTVPDLRTHGYREALALAGVQPRPEWIADGRYEAHGGEAAMRSLLDLPVDVRPTAVFCQSDEMAFGALHAVRAAGLRCPDDVSVMGVDDHELAGLFELTTVRQPVVEQGAAAARWLLEQLRRPRGRRLPDLEPVDHVNYHPIELVARSTTAPPPP